MLRLKLRRLLLCRIGWHAPTLWLAGPNVRVGCKLCPWQGPRMRYVDGRGWVSAPG